MQGKIRIKNKIYAHTTQLALRVAKEELGYQLM